MFEGGEDACRYLESQAHVSKDRVAIGLGLILTTLAYIALVPRFRRLT